MPKPRNLIPTQAINVHLPIDLATQISLHLFSEIDGRVPQGAYAKFFAPLIRKYFTEAHLDLAEWTGAPAGEQLVSGEPAAIELLHALLRRSS